MNKVKKLTSKEKRKNLLPYEHFSVIPPEKFDYENTQDPYCVYCGARYSNKFYETSLGDKTLCAIHYKIFRKNKLTIPEVKPKVPVNLDKNTELLYLNNDNSK